MYYKFLLVAVDSRRNPDIKLCTIFFARFGLLIAGASTAAWLRMFDYSLTLRSWKALIGQPISAWLVTIAIIPFYELLTSWWAFLLGSLLYAGFAWLWTKYNNRYLRQVSAVLLGLLVGGGFCLLLQSLRTIPGYTIEFVVFGVKKQINWWLYLSPAKMIEYVLIYASAGAVYGWLYYRWIINNSVSNQAGV